MSKEAARKGFSFEILSRTLITQYKQFLLVEAVEIRFVISSKVDVGELMRIAVEAQGLSIRKLARAQDGTYECDELNCERCSEKPTCDKIQVVLVIRKKGKIIGIEIIREPRGTPQKEREKEAS